MSTPVIIFVVLFVAAAVFIGIASGKERRAWLQRPEVLRRLASRRGFQFVENPGKPADLLPLRPVERKGNLLTVELPAAVRGRTLDTQFTLLDLYTETVSTLGSHKTHWRSYETFISFASPD